MVSFINTPFLKNGFKARQFHRTHWLKLPHALSFHSCVPWFIQNDLVWGSENSHKCQKSTNAERKKNNNYTSIKKEKQTKKSTSECLIQSSDLSLTNIWGREMWKSQRWGQVCGEMCKWVWGHPNSVPKELRLYTPGHGKPPEGHSPMLWFPCKQTLTVGGGGFKK